MASNTVLLGALNRLLADLNADVRDTVLTVHAAPVLTRPDFIARLEALLPHTLLVVLGDPTDAPSDAFPCVVSRAVGPQHIDLPPDWTSAGFYRGLAAEFGLALIQPEPISQVAAAEANSDRLEFAPMPRRRSEPLPEKASTLRLKRSTIRR